MLLNSNNPRAVKPESAGPSQSGFRLVRLVQSLMSRCDDFIVWGNNLAFQARSRTMTGNGSRITSGPVGDGNSRKSKCLIDLCRALPASCY